MLPGVDGWHIIRQAREWAPRLPIIVVTARTNEHDRVEVPSCGHVREALTQAPNEADIFSSYLFTLKQLAEAGKPK